MVNRQIIGMLNDSSTLNFTYMNPQLLAIANELNISYELIAARGLVEFQEAQELVIAEISDSGKEFLLTPAASQAWQLLKATAWQDGISLFIASAFRSIDHQTKIIQGKLDKGIAISEILTLLAPPGFSEHHTGRAIDISTPDAPAVQTGFEQTPAFFWLTANANRFGFYLSYPKGNPQGYQYEPWHWCYR